MYLTIWVEQLAARRRKRIISVPDICKVSIRDTIAVFPLDSSYFPPVFLLRDGIDGVTTEPSQVPAPAPDFHVCPADGLATADFGQHPGATDEPATH